MVESRKAAPGSQGNKVSAQVQEFLEEQERKAAGAGAAVPPPPAATVAASGFVPRSQETEREKEEQRTFDRSALLRVDDKDAQVQIYNQYARGANTTSEGVNTKRGLGADSGSGGGPRKKAMCFVSAGGAPATTAASAAACPGTAAASASAAGAAAAGAPAAGWSLPAGWTVGTDPASGWPYYVNLATGATQWEPPASAPPPLPPGWQAVTDPSTGHVYYYNASTGASSWTPPQAAAPSVAPAPAPPSDAAVRVTGLPAAMSEAEVRELFGTCGRIVRVTLDRGACECRRRSTRRPLARASHNLAATPCPDFRRQPIASRPHACSHLHPPRCSQIRLGTRQRVRL